MKRFIKVMKALSDQNRLKIMKMLEVKELCVCELTAILDLAQSTVSKHLKVLEDAGLVVSRRDGPWVNYCLCDDFETEHARVLREHLKQCLGDDPAILEVIEKVKTVDRKVLCSL